MSMASYVVSPQSCRQLFHLYHHKGKGAQCIVVLCPLELLHLTGGGDFTRFI